MGRNVDKQDKYSLENKGNLPMIKEDLEVCHRARSKFGFSVLLKSFESVWIAKGEKVFIHKLMKVYGSEKWIKWYVAAVPPGTGTDTNCEERLNRAFHSINGTPKSMNVFLHEALVSIFTLIRKFIYKPLINYSVIHCENTSFSVYCFL